MYRAFEKFTAEVSRRHPNALKSLHELRVVGIAALATRFPSALLVALKQKTIFISYGVTGFYCTFHLKLQPPKVRVIVVTDERAALRGWRGGIRHLI
jgi:hypothetical protein